MELESSVFGVIQKICCCFYLAAAISTKEGNRCFSAILGFFETVQLLYPNELKGRIRNFGLFFCINLIKEDTSELNRKRLTSTQFAAHCAHSYFVKRWPKVVKEVADPKTERLKTPATEAFKKIYYFLQDCSNIYYEKYLMSMHFYTCPDLKRHYHYDVVCYLWISYLIVRKLRPKKVSKKVFKEYGEMYPLFLLMAKRMQTIRNDKIKSKPDSEKIRCKVDAA